VISLRQRRFLDSLQCILVCSLVAFFGSFLVTIFLRQFANLRTLWHNQNHWDVFWSRQASYGVSFSRQIKLINDRKVVLKNRKFGKSEEDFIPRFKYKIP